MRFLFAIGIGALCLALSPAVSATVLISGDLGDLARGAAVVVRGRVVAVRTDWADGRRRVVTIVTVAVDETFKGPVGSQVSFTVPGGLMGRYRSIMVGAPTFHEGDEAVWFLGAQPPALPYVLGLGQGVFRIERDTRTGQTSVKPSALLSDPAGPVTVQRGDPSRPAQSLDAFSAMLRGVLSTARAKERREQTRATKGLR
ncbi:MAG TPA: hypothetical protein VGK32_19720 [Vicinamibacterales bacterium]|jgi:hypothetical protein